MLKFNEQSRSNQTSFENSICLGQAWEYNLYKIRPQAHIAFHSQLIGKKNVKNSCDDFKQKPIWNYLSKKNYKIGIFESQSTQNQSLLRANECKQTDFLERSTFWSMNKAPSKEVSFFHADEKTNFKENSVYYDKSCNSGNCFTNLSRNVIKTYESFSKIKSNYVYIMRDFEYLRELKRNNIKAAKEKLMEINDIFNYFQKIADKNPNTLVLLTSANTQNIDFPTQGKSWKTFLSRTKIRNQKNSKLINSVFAYGARAENFCGIYDQHEIMKRIFSGSKQQGLEFSIINPFDQ